MGTPRIRLSPTEYAAIMAAREQGSELRPPKREAAGVTDETRKGGKERVIEVVSEIRTVEDALSYAEIDTAIWEVERSVINKWDMGYVNGDGEAAAKGLWQVKVWLKRKAREGLTDALEAIHERAEKHSPCYDGPTDFHSATGDHNLVLSLYDQHFGKLCWHEETGNNYDLELAEGFFERAWKRLMAYAGGFDLERITIPFGNDFMHVDNIMLTTQAGTPQGADTEGRYAKLVETAFMSLVRMIEACASLAPVSLVLVMGNHDPTVMYHLARELRAWFRCHDAVTVDIAFNTRKYDRYGQTLICYTHGDKTPDSRLVNLMPMEAKQDWAKASYYEIHTGHLHLKRESRVQAVNTMEGIVLRRIPSLSGVDAWHYNKGYIGLRAAEAYVYHRELGPVGNFIAMADQELLAA